MTVFQRKKILVPYDFSDESKSSLDTALEIAEEDSQIHLIHVMPELNAADPGVIWQSINNENRSQNATEAVHEQLHDKKYDGIKIATEFGDPGHRIVDFAKELNADLIVMPTHGRRGLKHLLIGSVAERVTRLADCPVLVMRP